MWGQGVGPAAELLFGARPRQLQAVDYRCGAGLRAVKSVGRGFVPGSADIISTPKQIDNKAEARWGESVVNYASRVLVATILVTGGLITAAVFYEHRHPCLKYSTHRVFVA